MKYRGLIPTGYELLVKIFAGAAYDGTSAGFSAFMDRRPGTREEKLNRAVEEVLGGLADQPVIEATVTPPALNGQQPQRPQQQRPPQQQQPQQQQQPNHQQQPGEQQRRGPGRPRKDGGQTPPHQPGQSIFGR